MSLSEKTRKSNHLQMLEQREHLFSIVLRPWVLVRQLGIESEPPARSTGTLLTRLTRWLLTFVHNRKSYGMKLTQTGIASSLHPWAMTWLEYVILFSFIEPWIWSPECCCCSTITLVSFSIFFILEQINCLKILVAYWYSIHIKQSATLQ